MKVFFLSLKPETPNRDYWDYGLLEDFISGRLWKPVGWEDFETAEVSKLPKCDRGLVVLPARHHADHVRELNIELAKIDRVVLFLMGDEEADFPVEDVKHPSIVIWVQNPHPARHDAYCRLGTGYPPQIRQTDAEGPPDKTTDVFFSGQITHVRRQELQNYMPALPGAIDWTATKGFTQGHPHSEYYARMMRAKIAPAPSGAVIVDSFRLFEAFELMCLPIADTVSPDGPMTAYWDWLFSTAIPFATITDWSSLHGYVEDLKDEWPTNVHRVTAWWIAWKRSFAYTVMEQLNG